ncbi:NAD(P)/FAD-dependent oxidoreductase [Enterobacter cloacae complex sp. P3B]|uniref:NAD(P)/FAD-dependent oxidoreductase n=1 Tax=Enterobacter TaxID=547 RepID=UPI00186805D6|nr:MULTISPECIES: NAD(P)/FAD-dependent oxidoreductase [Enterobacter]MBE3177474.1 NAD(P)/FAD-dependent oxidoreductase [Enterobacter cloacae complex sp. P26RS]MBE3432868.1 NAD(P)/FAD-dependent oxidoreductase [Enterobacter cloacae complex sp. P21RS]MBE3458880.1 NAD(P)/FAD-dependent oxidoreductase [Enterobacter cloacae complex sp. P21C]MBE3499364.1 NAD(P)/FAD-dependent oxidoreductase [Enterobacter cloacae complex sp. P2B]MBE3504666.1 NAD(P)/FAD-dependent oxidoreductase [Enterobacter cloacae complex
MKKQILIVGSGFAGMWAAVSAARLSEQQGNNSLEIAVLAPLPELRVRPRFYEEKVSTLVAPLTDLFAELDITFIAGHAEQIDTTAKTVLYRMSNGAHATASYDRLILATGSQTKRPPIAGLADYAFDIDQLESAQVFERHLDSLALRPSTPERNTVVVCGGGFTGIELATELPARLRARFGDNTEIKIVVVERGPVIGGRYSDALRKTIAEASEALGVEWRLKSEVEAIDAHGVTLKNGERIAAATVVWTAGLEANPLSLQIGGERDSQGRLVVTETLQVPAYPDVYATGDMAHAKTDDAGNTALMTCQHAIQLGKFAGHNAAASLLNVAPYPYRQVNYVTCLDLGAWGAVYTEGWDQVVKSVQDDAKKIKIAITNELIYPPAADKAVAFAAADPLAKFV